MHSQLSKNEKAKFEKEYTMCKVLAQNGYKIEALKERPGFSSSDITINGIMAELKKTSSHNNIIKYAKKAIDIQGSKTVVFEFEEMTHSIQKELYKLQILGIHIKYFTTKGKVVMDLSEIQRPE